MLLPVLFLVLGLLLQPAILFYDRSVMSAAASEGCRLVATGTARGDATKGYIVRRLAGIPELEVFHLGGARGWEVSWEGPDGSGETTVRIVNRVRPLPLFGVVAGLGNSVDDDGNVVQRAEARSSSVPAWAGAAGSADQWIGGWQ